MRLNRLVEARSGRWWRGGLWAVVVVAALGARGASAASTEPAGLAATLSGAPAAPVRERAVGIGRRGIGIRFTAPATTTLTTVYASWRRTQPGCSLTLRADADGSPGAVLASAPIAHVEPAPGARRQPGWIATPLEASLRQGTVYHLVYACVRWNGAWLTYVVESERAAADGLWRLEHLRHRKAHQKLGGAAPLFALAFADGRWWGQPYRAMPDRPMIRICGTHQVEETIVPSAPVTLGGVQLPFSSGRRGHLEFTLSSGGRTILSGSLVRHHAPGRGRHRTRAAAVYRPAAIVDRVVLSPGVPYTIRLSAPAKRGGCLRQRALVTDLPLGRPVTGVAVESLGGSHDAGRTWEPLDASLGLSLLTPEDVARVTGGGDGPAGGGGGGAKPTRRYESIYVGGYLGSYDPRTVAVWPKKLDLILGGGYLEGAKLPAARALAASAGNDDVKFIYYFSMTDMDSRCGCLDQDFYDAFRGSHPEWILRNGSGGAVSTVNGIGRVYAVDIGNPAFVNAWADFALAIADRYGWDGVFADNVARGQFAEWSSWPYNPRTGAPYRPEDYRNDILNALQILRSRFHAEGKILVGNHSQSWRAETFNLPVTQSEILTMDGVEIEDCVFNYDGSPHTESEWIQQLRYLDFANQHGTRTVCCGSTSGAIGDPSRRGFLLASYLLTKEGFSTISELNNLDNWWDDLALDLGAPTGRYTCLDPNAGLAPTGDCPSPGKIYVREWEKGRVLANPSSGRTVTVPLGGTFLDHGSRVTSVTLGPRSGAVLVRPNT